MAKEESGTHASVVSKMLEDDEKVASLIELLRTDRQSPVLVALARGKIKDMKYGAFVLGWEKGFKDAIDSLTPYLGKSEVPGEGKK